MHTQRLDLDFILTAETINLPLYLLEFDQTFHFSFAPSLCSYFPSIHTSHLQFQRLYIDKDQCNTQSSSYRKSLARLSNLGPSFVDF